MPPKLVDANGSSVRFEDKTVWLSIFCVFFGLIGRK